MIEYDKSIRHYNRDRLLELQEINLEMRQMNDTLRKENDFLKRHYGMIMEDIENIKKKNKRTPV